MATIAEALNALYRAEQHVEHCEQLLKEAKEAVRVLEQDTLPKLFDDAEEFEVALPSGLKGKRKLAVIGALPKIDPKADYTTQASQRAAREAAFDWLDREGYGPLIKCTVIAEFEKGDKDKADALFREVRAKSNSAAVGLKEDIHPMTLFAQMRRRVEEGKEVPFEKLGLSVISVVELTKRPKESK